MTIQASPDDGASLLPHDWLSSPLRFWKEKRYEAFTFIWTAILVGSLGLWAPLVAALLTQRPISNLLYDMGAAGSLYLYVIPFTASIATSAFVTPRGGRFPARPWRLGILQSALVLILLACMFLTPYQLLADASSFTLNIVIQIVVSVLAMVAAVYVYCLLKLDVEQTFTDDVNRGADDLLLAAANAQSSRGDF